MKKLILKAAAFFIMAVLPLGTMAADKKNAKAPWEYVNLFMGTAGDNGQVTPAAAVPFGMLAVGPDCTPRQHSGYDYLISDISGISINRPSGVGCSGGGGNVRIIPDVPSARLKLVKETENAAPGYYGVTLDNGVSCEFTTTGNVAVERYVYPAGVKPVMTVDFAACLIGGAEAEIRTIGSNTISGWLTSKNLCSHGRYKLWFDFASSEPFTVAEQNGAKVVLDFAQNTKNDVEVRVAVSPVSAEASAKLMKDAAGKTFEDVRTAALDDWNRQLTVMRPEGGTEDDKAIFYTSLYRAFLSPADVTSPDGSYIGTDGKVYDAAGRRVYGSWSLWDTFRTKFPLLVVTHPERMSDICQALVHLYRTGKKNWSTPFEPTVNVRTEHASILLLDAYRKGITDFDLRPGYEGMKKEAAELYYDSPDHCLESVYDLWALAQLAEIIGEKTDSRQYAAYADSVFEKTWKEEFMNVTPAFKVMKNNGLYQGSRWQYRWAAPQYIDRMIEWAGRDSLCSQLSYFYDNNLYNQGNEPDIHVPFLFNRFGAPERSQAIVRRLLTDDNMIHVYGGNAEYPVPYVGRAFKNEPVGYSPEMDEDDGAMSAWYVFASSGFYPMLVGSDVYELVSPIFDRVTLNLSNGNKFVIKTKGRKRPDAPVKCVKLNGKKLQDMQLHHADIVKGGTLTFCY